MNCKCQRSHYLFFLSHVFKRLVYTAVLLDCVHAVLWLLSWIIPCLLYSSSFFSHCRCKQALQRLACFNPLWLKDRVLREPCVVVGFLSARISKGPSGPRGFFLNLPFLLLLCQSDLLVIELSVGRRFIITHHWPSCWLGFGCIWGVDGGFAICMPLILHPRSLCRSKRTFINIFFWWGYKEPEALARCDKERKFLSTAGGFFSRSRESRVV